MVLDHDFCYCPNDHSLTFLVWRCFSSTSRILLELYHNLLFQMQKDKTCLGQHCSDFSQWGTLISPFIILVNLLRGDPNSPQPFLNCCLRHALHIAIVLTQREYLRHRQRVLKNRTSTLAIGELIFSIFSLWPCFVISPHGTVLTCELESQCQCHFQSDGKCHRKREKYELWGAPTVPVADSDHFEDH